MGRLYGTESRPILIIGAGLAGLTLARALSKSKIPYQIFDSSTRTAKQGYGITLRHTTYDALARLLDVGPLELRKRLAVDALVGGFGSVDNVYKDLNSGQKIPSRDTQNITCFRANRRRIQELLKQDLPVHYKHKLARIERKGESVIAHFEDGQKAEGSLLVAADGVHSEVRRKSFPHLSLSVHPYVVYNGTRRMDPQLFKDTIEPLMANTTVVHGCKQSVALTISINDTTHEHVEMSLTYSRPAFTHKPDPLYRPDRSKEEAKIIPPELFDEIRALPHPFTPLFESVFDVENMPRDHLNHWLMRSIQVPEKDLLKVAESDRVILLGDAVHATVIFAGDGANTALFDGMELANSISASDDLDSLSVSFYEKSRDRWTASVKESLQRLDSLHRVSI